MRDTYESINAFYEGRELVLNTFKVEYFYQNKLKLKERESK